MARLGRPTKDPHTHGFLIKLTDSDNQLLLDSAAKTGHSKSDILRYALRQYADLIDHELK